MKKNIDILNDNLNEIFCEFERCSKKYVSSLNPLSYSTQNVIIGGKQPSTTEVCVLEYESFEIQFIYSPTATPSTIPASTLECRIFPDKSIRNLFFSPYDLIYLLDSNDMHCFFFPYIECALRMDVCFCELVSNISPYIEKIRELSENQASREIAYTKYKNEINLIYKQDIFAPTNSNPEYNTMLLNLRLDYYYKWKCSVFASSEYSDFLRGNYKRAQKRFKRYKNMPKYIQLLLEFMNKPEFQNGYIPVSTQANSLSDAIKAQTSRMMGLRSTLISALVFTPCFLLSYSVLYFILVYVGTTSAIYVTNMSLIYVTKLLIPAVITAMSLSCFTEQSIIRLFSKKHRKKIDEYTSILKTSRSVRSSKHFFNFIVILSIIITMFFSCCNVSFYDKGIKDNTDFFSISGEYYSYEEVTSVWLIDGRTVDGKWIAQSSYVIMFDDGHYIDFYALVDFDTATEKIKPIMASEGFTIRSAKDIKQIKELIENKL